MPFAIEVDGRFAGQVTVNNIVRGSAQFASIGYWLDRSFAGRGVMPLAVALVIDHCFTTAGLHRIEIAIRPENSNSLRVVEKLGLARVRVRGRGSCTSTATGATTGCTRSRPRSAPAGWSVGCSNLSSHTSSLATHLWTSAPP